MAELQRLAQRQLEHLLGPRRERDVSGRRRFWAVADDLLEPPMHDKMIVATSAELVDIEATSMLFACAR